MDQKWVQIESWHAVDFADPDLLKTVCGRDIPQDAEFVDDLPAAKSCELCLRIVVRDVDGA